MNLRRRFRRILRYRAYGEVVEAGVRVALGGPVSVSATVEGREEELVDEGDVSFHLSAEA